MLMKEILLMYEGKRIAEESQVVKKPGNMKDYLAKFKRAGGKIIGLVNPKSGTGASGKVGAHHRGELNQSVIVFYPDGTYDRFEKDDPVVYRQNWIGPEINNIDKID